MSDAPHSDRNARQLALLREIDGFLQRARIRYWLRGGWAVDFIAGTVRREHEDIDLVAWKRNERRMVRLFLDHGFNATVHPSTDFWKNGEETSILFLEKGDGLVYAAGHRDEPRWSADVLRGPMRELAGIRCRTISPRGLLEELENTPRWLGRAPRPKDAETKGFLLKLLATNAPSTARQSLGAFGERVAAAHLEAKGYRIVERNFRVFEAELDIIARDGDTWVFAEVRTRRGGERGMAQLSVNAAKSRRLRAAVDHYVEAHPEVADAPMRIDVVTVELRRDGLVERVEHIEGAVRG